MAEVLSTFLMSEIKSVYFYSLLQAKDKTNLNEMEENDIAYRRNKYSPHHLFSLSWMYFQP